MSILRLLACVPLIALVAAPLVAEDWPQFRGPNRDGVSKEKGLLQSWPKEGPPLDWSAKGLGGGFSTVSVAKDRIYTLGNKGKETHLLALDRKNGAVVWTAEVGPEKGHLGCTPTVDGDRIYALGQMGDLVCISQDGKREWHRNIKQEFGGVIGSWDYCESPLIDGDQLIVTPGGKDATIVALNKKSGETIWKCPIKTRHTESGYSSVVIAEVGGVKHYVQLFNGGSSASASTARCSGRTRNSAATPPTCPRPSSSAT